MEETEGSDCGAEAFTLERGTTCQDLAHGSITVAVLRPADAGRNSPDANSRGGTSPTCLQKTQKSLRPHSGTSLDLWGARAGAWPQKATFLGRVLGVGGAGEARMPEPHPARPRLQGPETPHFPPGAPLHDLQGQVSY